ncbi:hypothetical protein NVP1121O_207 [Vibrio phage 1.121.O._10N.286.46.C4]|nr:hypothetical protein NVP1121O_207 [Vibrio phage 1.121.O._10N.286.46.C4]
MGFRNTGGKGKKRNDPRKGVKRIPYNIPDDIDLKIHAVKVETLSKTLLEGVKAKPLTDTQIKQLFRDSVRKKWMHAPIKLSFLEKSKQPDLDPSSRRLWKWECAHCGYFFSQDEVEVDHLIGGDRDFETMADAPEYARGVLEVSHDDLQILCSDKEHGCHPIKSHAERYGMSFEEAKIDKEAIRWEKANKGVKVQRDLLESLGVPDAQTLKGKEIRAAYVKYLTEKS